jgi:hypothetical protein
VVFGLQSGDKSGREGAVRANDTIASRFPFPRVKWSCNSQSAARRIQHPPHCSLEFIQLTTIFELIFGVVSHVPISFESCSISNNTLFHTDLLRIASQSWPIYSQRPCPRSRAPTACRKLQRAHKQQPSTYLIFPFILQD